MGEYQPTIEDIRQLREWITKTPYIVQDYDEQFLKAVVRKCKGSLQKTKMLLENVNSLGMRHPEFFGHLDVFNRLTQDHLNAAHSFLIPTRAEDGSTICGFKLDFDKSDPYKFSLYEAHRYIMMSFYVLVWENLFGSGKFTVIFDWKNISPLHIREATPVYVKKSAEIRGQNYPMRIQAVHHVNVPSIAEWLVNTLNRFMNKKILERVHMHKSLESLHSRVSPKLLPKEYGGEMESAAILHSQWKKTVESYREKLVAESDKMRSLDSLRPKSNDSLDMVGTFRTLKVD